LLLKLIGHHAVKDFSQVAENVITLAKELAKSRGLIKRTEHSKPGFWELNEKANA